VQVLSYTTGNNYLINLTTFIEFESFMNLSLVSAEVLSVVMPNELNITFTLPQQAQLQNRLPDPGGNRYTASGFSLVNKTNHWDSYVVNAELLVKEETVVSASDSAYYDFCSTLKGSRYLELVCNL
jgi:hypothetical protein